MKTAYVAILLCGALTTVTAWGFDNIYGEGFKKCSETNSAEGQAEGQADGQADGEAEGQADGQAEDHHKRPRGNFKQMWSCVFTFHGVMKDDKFDKEGYVKLIEHQNEGDFDKDERVAEAQKIADACDAEIGAGGATKFETAHKIHVCLMEAEHPDMKTTRQLRRKCMTDEKVDFKVAMGMRPDHKIPNNDGAKRLIRCLLTAQGVMEDGKFSKDGYLKFIEKNHDSDQYKDMKVDIAGKMADICNDKVGALGETPEDRAKNIQDCLVVETKKVRGVIYQRCQITPVVERNMTASYIF